ncbi:hypothetical protein, partial [Balneola sp. EhC07]|uniref:hypothetical protein n=1 Tax=Balneola sp. EhC07 TaxID=1849360 RepID=UPI00137244FE
DSTYIYEWDFKENITKKIHAYSGSFYTPKVFFDRANDLYFLNLINNVDIYRNNHTELSSFGDMDGFMKKIIHKEDTEYFVLDTYGIRIYLIDILSKNSSEIFHNRFLKDIVLVNNHNILVSNNSSVSSPYSSEIFFLNRNTHSVSLQKNINNKILSLSYNPNLDQLIMRNPSGYSFYDFNNLWEWVDN